jgi:hypothetical protein
VLSHRLVLTAQALLDRRSAEDLVRDVLARVPVPQEPKQPPLGRLDALDTSTGDRVAAFWPRSPQRR